MMMMEVITMPRPNFKKGPRRRKMFNMKKKACRICADQIRIDHKDDRLLANFVMESGKIVPKRTSGVCAKHQRELTTAIKRARILAFLPFSSQQLVD